VTERYTITTIPVAVELYLRRKGRLLELQ